MRKWLKKLLVVWVLAISAGVVGVVLGQVSQAYPKNGEIVVCKTEWLNGDPIGCTGDTVNKLCILGKDEEGHIILGRCTPFSIYKPDFSGKGCPCM